MKNVRFLSVVVALSLTGMAAASASAQALVQVVPSTGYVEAPVGTYDSQMVMVPTQPVDSAIIVEETLPTVVVYGHRHEWRGPPPHERMPPGLRGQPPFH